MLEELSYFSGTGLLDK